VEALLLGQRPIRPSDRGLLPIVLPPLLQDDSVFGVDIKIAPWQALHELMHPISSLVPGLRADEGDVGGRRREA
jgi:hypothetical protein